MYEMATLVVLADRVVTCLQVRSLHQLDIIAATIKFIQMDFKKALRVVFYDKDVICWNNLETLCKTLEMDHFNPAKISMPGCLQTQTSSLAVEPTITHFM